MPPIIVSVIRQVTPCVAKASLVLREKGQDGIAVEIPDGGIKESESGHFPGVLSSVDRPERQA